MLLLALTLACAGWKKQIRQGDDWMERDNPGAAAREYAKAEKDRPEDPLIQFKLAQALVADEQFVEAVPHAQVAYDEEIPGSPEVLARALLGAGRPAEVIPIAQGEITVAEDARFHLLLARAELGRGDLTASRYWYEEALKKGSSLEIRAGQAYVSARLGDGSRVGSVTLDAREDADTAMGVWAELGAAWLAAGDWTNGRNAGAQVLVLDPSVESDSGLRGDWIREADGLARSENYEPALRLALMAAAIQPDDAQLAWKIGAWAAALGDWQLAARWMEHALVTPPYDAPEQNTTAGVAVATVNSEISDAERKRLRREIGGALARAYQELGDPASEAKAWEVVLRSLEQADPEAWHRHAVALFKAGDYLASAQSARQATSQGHAESASVAARAYRRLGDMESAAGWAMTAWQAAPGDPELALLLAELYVADQRFEAALGVIDKGLAAHPDHQGLLRARKRVLEAY